MTLPLSFQFHPALLGLIQGGGARPGEWEHHRIWGRRSGFRSWFTPCWTSGKLPHSSEPHLTPFIKWTSRDLPHRVIIITNVYNVRHVLLRVVQMWCSSSPSRKHTRMCRFFASADTCICHLFPPSSSDHCLPPPTDTPTPLETGLGSGPGISCIVMSPRFEELESSTGGIT